MVNLVLILSIRYAQVKKELIARGGYLLEGEEKERVRSVFIC